MPLYEHERTGGWTLLLQTDRQTNTQTYRQTDMLITILSRQTDRHTHRQTDRQTDTLIAILRSRGGEQSKAHATETQLTVMRDDSWAWT